jgi:deoxyribodipyrimidine photo-lyase
VTGTGEGWLLVRTAIALFTRDLRVHDNPVLHGAIAGSDRVVPLFVLDDGILAGRYNRPNRATFLAQALRDLDGSLRERGGALVVRRGDVVGEVTALAAELGAAEVHVAGDVSAYAQGRQQALAGALEGAGSRLVRHEDALLVVPPGRLTPSGGDHMAVFGAYYRRWVRADRRGPLAAPRSVELPPKLAHGRAPSAESICPGERSPKLPAGGESAGRERLANWLRSAVADYADRHDDLAGEGTSRLSPYLHFGCVSPVELVHRAPGGEGGDALVRQVAWRDFHHQVLAARPDSAHRDYRPRGDRWRRSQPLLTAWKQGRTGVPLVDAGMRQLAREGWMHNRARLIVGHFLCKTMYLDWRLGARHFFDLLVDGDMANNTMNWQWVAGTGTDSRYNRVFNTTRQAERYDPDGEYVRRYVPELAGIEGFAVHDPAPEQRREAGYPQPVVDEAQGNRDFLAARGR